MRLIEVQVDRLVGPTHHFGGLGVGNIASSQHAWQPSNPAAAALQGLDKMRLVAGLGVPQVILPPQVRPDIGLLRSLGFHGTLSDVLAQAQQQTPSILSAAMSCSAMWTANAATVAPAVDSGQDDLTITIANLTGSLHRAIEPPQTTTDLKRTFSTIGRICPPLLGGTAMRDEGAANHMRLATANDQPGLHLLVHGDGSPATKKYWPRQTLAASQSVARTMHLNPKNVFFLKQNAQAIDAGAFHNDVVAASHENLLLHHELAFERSNRDDPWPAIEDRFREVCGDRLVRIEVPAEAISIDDAVATYLFNSQIVSSPDPSEPPILICPAQVHLHPGAREIVETWRDQLGLFSHVYSVDLSLSMAGGGGPACLRLRVPVSEDQLPQLPPSMLWSEQLDTSLRQLIQQHYPTHVTIDDLADESFVHSAEETTRLVRERILAG